MPVKKIGSVAPLVTELGGFKRFQCGEGIGHCDVVNESIAVNLCMYVGHG